MKCCFMLFPSAIRGGEYRRLHRTQRKRAPMTILLYELVGADAGRPFSPHCWKTAMSLAHKGLDFERVPTPFTERARGRGRRVENRAGDPRRRQGGRGFLRRSRSIWRAYPDRPTLFGGEGGKAMARFIERWSQLTIHPYLGAAALIDIHAAAGDRPTRPISARAARSATARRWRRSRRPATPALPPSAPRSSRCAACSPTSPSSAGSRRSLPTTSSSARSSGCASCRPIQMLAEGDPGGGLVRALPRPAWRARPQRAGGGCLTAGLRALARRRTRLYRARHLSNTQSRRTRPWRSNAPFR